MNDSSKNLSIKLRKCNDKGKPPEKVGRKAKGPSVLKRVVASYRKGFSLRKYLKKLVNLYTVYKFVRPNQKRKGGIKMLKKMNKIAALTMLLSVVGTGTAFAAEPTAGITGGDLSIQDFASANFTAVTLDGTTQTTTSAVTDMTLIDATGTGAGWDVNLQATTLTNALAANGTDLKTLPEGSLALGAVSIVATEGSSAAVDITNVSGTIDSLTGITILNADINEGMGTYTVSIGDMTLTLLPKDAKAGTYTSTITMTLTQGPSI